jgi:hypothetical protein
VVAAPSPQARAGQLEVALPGGLLLRFAVGTDTGYLAHLLSALG